MSPEIITAVRASFAAAAPAAGDLTQRFYARLFDLDPTLRRKFPADLTEQRRKLAGALAFMMATLDRPDQLVPALQSLGRAHAGYGVEERHYDTVAAARAAWIEVCTTASSVMKEAGREYARAA